MQPTIRTRAGVALAVTSLLAAGLSVVPSAAAQGTGAAGHDRPSWREIRLGDHLELRRKKVRTIHRKIAPGLNFTKIVDEKTPRRIFIIRADVANFPITYDVTLAGPTLGYRATVPQMARQNGALVAINGDFSSRIVGRPIHAYVQDGTFVQSAGPGGASFALSKNEQRTFAGAPHQEMMATDSQTGLTWRIDRWNSGPPDVGELAAFSPAGGSLETPPADACSAHLAPTAPSAPVPDGPGFEQTFSIDAHACQAEAMSVADGVVLSTVAGTDEATNLMSLALGTTMTVRLSLGWTDAYDVMGGDTMLVQNGQIAPCAGVSCAVQPRTGIGVQADSKVLFVVVDGRQPRYSLGLTDLAFARLMKRLGAVDAVNLDGGGASTFVVEGKLVNRPSDGSPRHVATAALILPGADPGES